MDVLEKQSQFIFCGRKLIYGSNGGGGGAPEPPTSRQMLYHLKFKPDAFYLMC